LIGETSVTADLVIGIDTITKVMPDIQVHAVVDGVERKVKPEMVEVTANIPKLLMNEKTDPRDLFSVIAMQREEGGMLKVKVIPRPDNDLSIEVLSIVPSSVFLLDAEKDVSVSAAEPIENDQSQPVSEFEKK